MPAGAVRVGIDLVSVRRIAELAEDRDFLARVFQPAELADTRPEHLAGLLAAKEACFKALGVPARWLEVAVAADPSGRPTLRLGPGTCPPSVASFDVSISHEGDFAVAVVVALLVKSDEQGDAGAGR
jgi:holo-[acyl-carrier protein] synthase